MSYPSDKTWNIYVSCILQIPIPRSPKGSNGRVSINPNVVLMSLNVLYINVNIIKKKKTIINILARALADDRPYAALRKGEHYHGHI